MKAPERLDVTCPLCGETISLPFTLRASITFSGSSTKGFVTADVGIGGTEHTCSGRPSS